MRVDDSNNVFVLYTIHLYNKQTLDLIFHNQSRQNIYFSIYCNNVFNRALILQLKCL